ncbi:MAG TPA: hypothetical protein VFQ88_09460 [Nevskiaceae bacterium]|nr:hypothetical protein [Nevskiaceae bacterium]
MSAQAATAIQGSIAALATDAKALYDVFCYEGMSVAEVARQTGALCASLQALVEHGAGKGDPSDVIVGASRPTGRGAMLPLGTPAPDVTRDVQAHLRKVPSLVFDAWLALRRYAYWHLDDPSARFREAVWRLADAHLILHVADAQPDLSQRRLTVDCPIWHRIDAQLAALEPFAQGAVTTARFVLRRARVRSPVGCEMLGDTGSLSRDASEFRAAGAYADVVRVLVATLQRAAAKLLIEGDAEGAEADLADVQPASAALALAADTDVSQCDPAVITPWLDACEAVLSRSRGVPA